MFVSIYLIGYLKLKEVKTKEEAFCEMRRYMEINNIYSDVTVLSGNEFVDRFGVSETVQLVQMQCQSGYHLDEIIFGIHDRTCPDYDSIADALEHNSHFKYCYNSYNADGVGYNTLKCTRYASESPNSRYYSWLPDEYERYSKDSDQRVGEICH